MAMPDQFPGTNSELIESSGPPLPKPSECYDDMHDSDDELTYYSSLPLGLCGQITTRFEAVDKSALSHQKTHRRLTRWAASLGTAAVLFAILELGYREHFAAFEKHLLIGELACALFAGAIAWYGETSAHKEEWLVQRHQAEAYRLLKYRLLVKIDLWSQSLTKADEWIKTEMKKIAALEGKKGLHEAVKESAPHGPFLAPGARLDAATLRQLIEYYLSKRLNPQKEYLANRAQRNEHRILDRLPAWLFFASVTAVVFKFFADVPHAFLGSSHNPGPKWFSDFHEASIFLTVLGAASLPVLAAGVRTWRAAFEFSRNKSRFQAAHRALAELEERIVHDGVDALGAVRRSPVLQVTLRREQTPNTSQMSLSVEQSHTANGNAQVDAYPMVRDLWWCEHILESEHREWLRLMYETEWFG